MECGYLEFVAELIVVDLDTDWGICIPDANLAIACCVRDERLNGDEHEEIEESLSFSPVPLWLKWWWRADVECNVDAVDDSLLTDARNGKAVAALKALALPGSWECGWGKERCRAAAACWLAAALHLSLPHPHSQLPGSASAFNAATAFPFLASVRSESSTASTLHSTSALHHHFNHNGTGENDKDSSISSCSSPFSRSSLTQHAIARLASGMQMPQSVSKSTTISSATNSKYPHSIASLTGDGGAHAFNSPPLSLPHQK
jgi:hypothetical protein